MQYKHLTIEERETIQELLREKHSIRAIARILCRPASCISREIKRNLPLERVVYTPRLAHARALEKRKSRGRIVRLKSEDIRMYVIEKLHLRWSPEQIAGRIKKDLGRSISHEAIYQFIYHQIHREGHGTIKMNCIDLRPCLRRSRKRRQPTSMRRSQRVLKPRGPSIDTRPSVVSQKKRFGDWEADSVISNIHTAGVNTLLERKSGYYLVTKLKDKTSAATVAAIASRMDTLPQSLKRTLTTDNGSEFSDWQAIERLGLDPYFAHPYCSGERGANENTNGLLRDYFPKGTDFTLVSDAELSTVEYALNTRPRKRLGWRTPLEVIGVALRG
jgi:transposase, IS30 family